MPPGGAAATVSQPTAPAGRPRRSRTELSRLRRARAARRCACARACSIASGVVANTCRSWASSSNTPSRVSTCSCSGRTPDSSTVMPRASSRVIVSASTEAPVASRVVHARHAQDHDADVGHLRQLEQERVGGAEEQRALEPVGHDVLGEQRAAPRRRGRAVSSGRLLVDVRGARDLLQREEARHDEAEDHRGHQVEDDRGRGGHARAPTASPRVARSSARRLDTSHHLDRGRDAGRRPARRAGSARPAGASDEHHDQQHERRA